MRYHQWSKISRTQPRFEKLNTIVSTGEWVAECTGIVIYNDTLDRCLGGSLAVARNEKRAVTTYISTCSQEIKTDQDEKHVDDKTNPAADTTGLVKVGTVIGTPHANVSDTPEDESKEGVKEGAHDGEQIREEGNDLGHDEGERPQHSQNAGP